MTFGDDRVPESFWSKVLVADSGCWEWTASKRHYGYGQFVYEKRHYAAHRFSYERMVGPIGDGLVLDHLCRNTACVHPNHVEPVTQRENLLRGAGLPAINAVKTHCKHGHEFTEQNTYTHMGRTGLQRQCRTCKRLAMRQWREGRTA